MPSETDANKGAGSPPAQNGATDPGSPPAEEVLAENKRKADKIVALEAAKSQMEARIKELEDKSELTKREELEREDLATDIETIRNQARQLRSQAQTKPWIEIAREEANMSLSDYLIKRGNWYLDNQARNLKITTNELVQKLGAYVHKYLDLEPERRNELAFMDWQADENDRQLNAKLKDENKKLTDENLAFREGKGRLVRDDKGKQIDQRFADGDKRDRTKLVVDLLG